MAKKKKVEPDTDDEDGFDDDLYDDEDIEVHIPKIGEKPAEKEQVPEAEIEELELEEEEPELIEDFDGEEVEIIDYKHLSLELNKGLNENENDYELIIKGQSHGFCNIFIKHLLEIEGVSMAAYKDTSLKPSELFIRLLNGYNIKEILLKCIESLREEVIQIQDVFFQKLT